jgi:serine/threonine-protein kinase
MRELETEHTVVERFDRRLGALVGGRYQIRDRIAEGGFGAVYRALDLATNESIAIKVLHRQLVADHSVVARFRREGAALASLRDPHTVRVLDVGECDSGTLFIVMELLRGKSLHELFESEGRLPWQRVVAIARGVCDALSEAHALGIVHRDLKPANIHLERGDVARVVDFGIAKVLRGSQLDDSDLTHAGQMIGTFDYMPPEQMIGAPCDARTDLFTLGVVMYEMITGVRPYGLASSPTAMLSALLGTTPKPMSELAPVPRELDRIVARCIAHEREDRYQSAAELARELDRLVAAVAAIAHRRSPPRRAARRGHAFVEGQTLLGVAPATRPPPDPRVPEAPRPGPWPLAIGTNPIQNVPAASPGLPSGHPHLRLLGWMLLAIALGVFAALVVNHT